ncbi:hypothetical protein HZS_895 [Henneguya salminicola]|nr:hypothetical protein HZS_895 [Henneguya salminicola]
MPKNMSHHLNNSSKFDKKLNKFSWTIKLQYKGSFLEKDVSYTMHSVPGTSVLYSLVSNYIDKDNSLYDSKLSQFSSIFPSNVLILLLGMNGSYISNLLSVGIR